MNENRLLATMPALKAKRAFLDPFPQKFEAYYGDHFGFRRALIRGLSLARLGWLGVSTSPHVVVGDEGWLYYLLEQVGSDYETVAPFTLDQLEHWQHLLEQRRDWLCSRAAITSSSSPPTNSPFTRSICHAIWNTGRTPPRGWTS